MTYLTSGHLFPSQTFKSYIKGHEIFDSEGGIKNNSFVNNNDYYPEQRGDVKTKTKGDDKNGQYTYTSIAAIPDGEITAFIKNEVALNDKNNFIHTPSAGVLFCSSLDENKWEFRNLKMHKSGFLGTNPNQKFNPTSKMTKFNLQNSKGSEATTYKGIGTIK